MTTLWVMIYKQGGKQMKDSLILAAPGGIFLIGSILLGNYVEEGGDHYSPFIGLLCYGGVGIGLLLLIGAAVLLFTGDK